MEKNRVYLNKEIMKELRKTKSFKSKTNNEGRFVMNAITKVFKKTLRAGEILNLGFCWLYPKKNEIFKKRNKLHKNTRIKHGN